MYATNTYFKNETLISERTVTHTRTKAMGSKAKNTNNFTSIHLLDGVDSDRCPDVKMAGNTGRPDEEPVLIVGGQLLGHIGLHHIHPVRDRHLTGPTTS